MPEFRLVIPGEPVAKARPKLAVVHGHARAFTPAKTRRYEDIVRNVVAQQWNGRAILQEVPIVMRAVVYRSIPASWPKKRQQAARAGVVRPTGKPDWDNFAKALCDGLNGIVFLDDALVVEASIAKHYSDQPRTEVTLSWPDGEQPVRPPELALEHTTGPPARSPPRNDADLNIPPF